MWHVNGGCWSLEQKVWLSSAGFTGCDVCGGGEVARRFWVQKRWQKPAGGNGDQVWMWTPDGSPNQIAFTLRFRLIHFLTIGLGIPAFSLRPVKLNLIYWFDAVNIPFLWIYLCFKLLRSVANWAHVTNSCFLVSRQLLFWHCCGFPLCFSLFWTCLFFRMKTVPTQMIH